MTILKDIAKILKVFESSIGFRLIGFGFKAVQFCGNSFWNAPKKFSHYYNIRSSLFHILFKFNLWFFK